MILRGFMSAVSRNLAGKEFSSVSDQTHAAKTTQEVSLRPKRGKAMT